MNNKFLSLLFLIVLGFSCTQDEQVFFPSSELSEYEINVIDYFKDIALGFEFGSASKITRKWGAELRIFIGGSPNSELLNQLENIISEVNELTTDGFRMNIVNDSLQSNYYIFFGTGAEYAEMFQSQMNFVDTNWGLFSIYWNSQNQLISGHMYVDIIRANATEQIHLLREELTQSLGLGKDSPRYQESIFQSKWTTTTQYARIDRDLIRLLYHPNMNVGLNSNQVGIVLRDILLNE
ncbi:MAG: DUF2927 domain-containing protein [Saprospiraceae bacterium]